VDQTEKDRESVNLWQESTGTKKKDEKSDSPHSTKSTVSLKRVPINLTLQQDKSYKEQSFWIKDKAVNPETTIMFH